MPNSGSLNVGPNHLRPGVNSSGSPEHPVAGSKRVDELVPSGAFTPHHGVRAGDVGAARQIEAQRKGMLPGACLRPARTVRLLQRRTSAARGVRARAGIATKAEPVRKPWPRNSRRESRAAYGSGGSKGASTFGSDRCFVASSRRPPSPPSASVNAPLARDRGADTLHDVLGRLVVCTRRSLLRSPCNPPPWRPSDRPSV